MTSPGESLTAVWGPGGFGNGGRGDWQPNTSAAETRKANRQEHPFGLSMRQTRFVPGNCRSYGIFPLSCVMQRRLPYKFGDWQEKCDEADDEIFRPPRRRILFQTHLTRVHRVPNIHYFRLQMYRPPGARLYSPLREGPSGSRKPPSNGRVRRLQWTAAASDRKIIPRRTSAYSAAW